MSSEKNTYVEMPVTQEIYKFESPQLMRQPIVVAVNINNSMRNEEEGQQKTNLKLVEDGINRIGQDPELKEEDKKTTDFCIMTFSENTTSEKNWIPLLEYHGGITLNKAGVTAFHDVVKQSLNAIDTIKNIYQAKGIQYKRPQIFIITDEYSKDLKSNSSVVAEAKELCEKYVDTNKVALHIILLPGEIELAARQLSSNVKISKVGGYADGLPANKDFINISSEVFSSSMSEMNVWV